MTAACSTGGVAEPSCPVWALQADTFLLGSLQYGSAAGLSSHYSSEDIVFRRHRLPSESPLYHGRVGQSWGELDASAAIQSAHGVLQPNTHRWWVAPRGYLYPLDNERGRARL